MSPYKPSFFAVSLLSSLVSLSLQWIDRAEMQADRDEMKAEGGARVSDAARGMPTLPTAHHRYVIDSYEACLRVARLFARVSSCVV
jgi:hypothetical protein